MSFCIYCGSKLKDEAKFCVMCGKKVSNVDVPFERKETHNNDREKEIGVRFDFLGYELIFSKDVVEYNRRWKEFSDKILEVTKEYENFFRNEVGTYEAIFSRGIPYVSELIYMLFSFAVRVLRRDNINCIGEPDFEEVCTEKIQIIIEEKLESLIEFSDEIAKQKENIQYARGIQRESRSQWEGGGFGFSGAIKGAIMAGILNAGTNAVRKVADFYTDTYDNQMIARKKREYFANGNCLQQLRDTVYECGSLVFKQTYEFLVMQKKMPQILFRDEKECRNVNYYLKRIENNNTDEVKKNLFEAIMQNIKKNPYGWELYDMLYHLFPHKKYEINKVVDYFCVGYYYYESTKYIDQKRLEFIKRLPDGSLEELELKEACLEELVKEAKDISVGNLFAELKKKRQLLSDL